MLLERTEELQREALRQQRQAIALAPTRRERIATAIYASANPTQQDGLTYSAMADAALVAADALINALDNPAVEPDPNHEERRSHG